MSGQAHRFPVDGGSHIYRQSALEGGTIAFLVHICDTNCVEPRAIVRPEELCQ